jgi:predicted lipase
MHYTKTILFLILFTFSLKSSAQSNFFGTGETGVIIKHRVSKKYNMAFLFRSRYTLFKDENFDYSQNQLHFIHFSTYNFNYSHSVSLGLDYRNQDFFGIATNEIRITEQFNYIKQKLGVRYGHRFRAEQRLFESQPIYRQRYRFAVDFPVNGEKLDLGEAYLIFSTEALWSFSKNIKPFYEQRLTSQIGWQVLESLKLQIGLDYRLEAFNISSIHNLFILTSGILKI